jgi:predicted RNase H-like nuclease (RuvC/YqgF family)
MQMSGDIRDEWRINDIERKAQEASDKANEVYSLRSDVDRLECSNRDLSSALDGLRHELQALKDGLSQATQY